LFCPKCGDEFVAGLAVCPDCGLPLVDEPPSRAEREPEDGEEWVTVATFRNMFDASVARGALEADGLSAFVPGENIGAFARVTVPGTWVEVKVRASDRDRAVELLKRAGHK
jgi:hypothetical protein